MDSEIDKIIDNAYYSEEQKKSFNFLNRSGDLEKAFLRYSIFSAILFGLDLLVFLLRNVNLGFFGRILEFSLDVIFIFFLIELFKLGKTNKLYMVTAFINIFIAAHFTIVLIILQSLFESPLIDFFVDTFFSSYVIVMSSFISFFGAISSVFIYIANSKITDFVNPKLSKFWKIFIFVAVPVALISFIIFLASNYKFDISNSFVAILVILGYVCTALECFMNFKTWKSLC